MFRRYLLLMTMALLSGLPCAVVAAPPASTGTQAAGPTRDDVINFVKKAIAYYKTVGREKALAEFNNKEGQFNKGELYIVVHDINGVCLAHPVTPAVVGMNRMNQADPSGVLFVREMVEGAKKNGSGWVELLRKNPVTGAMQAKENYYKLEEGLVFNSGRYK